MDKKLLQTLCELDGISGREEAVRAYILKELETISVPHETSVDAMGNVLVHLHGKQPAGHRLLLDAHMDEVGFLVSHITPEGYLRFQTVGGIDKQVLFGRRVRIGAQPGVIGGKAIHHCSKKESEQIPAVEDMLIDIGAGSAEEAEKLVAIGAAGTFASAFVPHGENGFVGKAVDDRVGCALLLTLAKKQPARDVWLSFSVQEEVGLRGAGAAAYAVRPDVAIAIDATTAADTVGSTRETAVCRVGDGAVVSFADRATLYDPELYQTIRHLAQELHIPTQAKNRIAGGNNAGSIQRSGSGVRMAAVSLPCRYIHSPACTGSWADVEAMEQLLGALIERLSV